MDHTEGTVRTDDLTMRYIRFGHGKRTFVILPGLSIKSVLDMPAAVMGRFADFRDDYTIYVFDRRSDLPESYSVEDMAHDTAEAMLWLGLRDVYVFGASQGGMMALTIAADHPDLIKKCAVASSSLRVTSENGAVIAKWLSLARKGLTEELCLSFGKDVYPEEVFRKYRDAFVAMASMITPEDLRRFTVLADETNSFDISGRADRISCPVLAVWDDTDAVFTPETHLFMQEKLSASPDFQTKRYSGYGHAVYDLAEDFKDVLRSFFSE